MAIARTVALGVCLIVTAVVGSDCAYAGVRIHFGTPTHLVNGSSGPPHAKPGRCFKDPRGGPPHCVGGR